MTTLDGTVAEHPTTHPGHRTSRLGVRTSSPRPSFGLGDLLEGQTAAHMVVAADELGWWNDLLTPGGTIRPLGGVARTVADALARLGWITPHSRGSFALTDAGQDIAVNRGFVRVATRGWEPTMRAAGPAALAGDDHIPAATEPHNVARGCTDIARRHPETIAAIATRLADDPQPGTTIDLGCADAGRLQVIGELAPDERLVGVDIEADVVAQASERLSTAGFDERVRLRHGSVQPRRQAPPWLDRELREDVTTAMSFFLLHQLASDGGGIAAVLRDWTHWFPNLRRFVIGDAVFSEGAGWHEKPWFAPTYETYHALTGVRLWWDDEYRKAFSSLGFSEVERHDADHDVLVTTVLER